MVPERRLKAHGTALPTALDSEGNVSNQDLTFRDGTWTWSGAHARATGVLDDDHQSMPTLHEWSNDGANWRASMDITSGRSSSTG